MLYVFIKKICENSRSLIGVLGISWYAGYPIISVKQREKGFKIFHCFDIFRVIDLLYFYLLFFSLALFCKGSQFVLSFENIG